MSVWITGSYGMLGSEVTAACDRRGIDHVATDAELDITDPFALRGFAEGKEISVIINCAAFTAVDRAEQETELAFRVNATGAGNLAKLAHKIKCRLIHVSTDYVFNGRKGSPYLPDDETDPLSAYGRSKLEGERMVLAECPAAAIVRTAWMYGLTGANFVATMLKLFSTRGEVRVVDDQIGSPTLARDMAEALVEMSVSTAAAQGIYHYTNSGETTWFGFAARIYKLAKEAGLTKREVALVPITTAEYPTPAIRPAYSVLDCSRIEKDFGVSRRPWDEALTEHIARLREEKR